jgi:cell division protein FtsZ
VEKPVAFDPVSAALAANDEEEAPLIFELSIDTPAAPETPAAPVVAAAPEKNEPAVYSSEPVKMTNDHPVYAGGFLNKPNQVYSTSVIQPAVKKEEEKQPAPVMKEAEADINAISLTEEALQPVLKTQLPAEEEEVMGISLSYDEVVEQPKVQASLFNEKAMDSDLSEEEEQKRRAQERINRLRNLSFNPLHIDNSSEFENVPAYMRRNMELHNSIANVEDFYSRAQVKSDDNNQASISTLNNFLHGEKPD